MLAVLRPASRALAVAGLSLDHPRGLIRQRLRPERGAKSPRERERGWGPASIDKCPV